MTSIAKNKGIPCRVCHQNARSVFQTNLLDESVRYYECPHCGYVQTEDPYWLDRAYSEAINVSDTGVMSRNITNRNIVLAILLGLGLKDAQAIDFAGGYGLLVRLLRDAGVDAYWMDKYCDNLVARGFEYTEEMRGGVCTAFEVFEHLVHPAEETEEMFRVAPNLLFSTEVIPDPTPSPESWWYYGLHHGQHIGFFRIKTLEFLADKFGKVLLTNGRSYHMLCDPQAVNWFAKVFPLAIRLSRFMPLISSRFLQSRTWSDHEYLSCKG